MKPVLILFKSGKKRELTLNHVEETSMKRVLCAIAAVLLLACGLSGCAGRAKPASDGGAGSAIAR